MKVSSKLSYHPNTRRFLKDCFSKLKEYNINVVFCDTNFLKKQQIVGYYDGQSKKLLVCKRNPNWLTIFVHEYSHFLQDIENCKIYARYNCLTPGPQEIVDRWIKGKKHPKKKVKKAFNLIRELEMDCEKRSLQLIRKYNLPIDKIKYTQEANSILYQYFVEEQDRKKVKHLPRKFIEKMPKRLLKIYAKKAPKVK
jgi:hypothetical protein